MGADRETVQATGGEVAANRLGRHPVHQKSGKSISTAEENVLMKANMFGWEFCSLFSLCALIVAVPTAPANSALINEIRIDQGGADDDEYFELLGTDSESLDTLTYLVIGDGSGSDGTIESVTSLAGQTIGSSGYFVVAESTFTIGTADLTTTLNFENSDNVTHLLVDGFTGANGDDLDTDDDGVLDVEPWTSVVDGVALIEEVNPPAGTEFEYASDLGLPTVGPDGTFVPGHVYRFLDNPANTSWTVGPFDIALGDDTPGAMNVPEPGAILITLLAACLAGIGGLRARLG
jgi:hypothetical protein